MATPVSTEASTVTGLERERRLRPRFSVLAALAGGLLLASAIIQQSLGPHTTIQEATLGLLTESKRAGLDVAGGIIAGVSELCLAATLVFLLDAVRVRSPQVSPLLRIGVIVGCVLSAITGIVYPVIYSQRAHEFATTGNQTWVEAHHLTSTGLFVVLPLIGLLGTLLVAMAFVLVSLQSMRVGLLTRFMGYLGMFSGALLIFQFTPLPVVEIYWLAAVAMLLAGRWPTGQPRAWQSGQAEPWPSSQEMREQRIRAAGARGRGAPRGRLAQRLAGQAAREPAAAEAEALGTTRSSSPRSASASRRKRKRRR